jgi:hypothetical protein
MLQWRFVHNKPDQCVSLTKYLYVLYAFFMYNNMCRLITFGMSTFKLWRFSDLLYRIRRVWASLWWLVIASFLFQLQVVLEIPSKLTGAGMVRVSIHTVMPEGASKDDACEWTALDALQLLQHDYDLNVLDCNWFETLEIRAQCAILVD